MPDAIRTSEPDSSRDSIPSNQNITGRLLTVTPLKPPHDKFEDLLKHLATEVVEASVEYANESITYHEIDGKPYGLASEFADIIILTVLGANRLGIDINDAINRKLDYLHGR